MENYTLPLDNQTGKYLSLYLFTDVKNTPEIRKKVMSGEIKCCIAKASMVVDPLQIAVAANKASLRELRSQLTTKSLFTEILYVMSSSTNISLSLGKFGIHDNDKNIIIIVIHSEQDRETMEQDILKHIDGQKTPIERIPEFADKKLVKKTYKIEDQELEVSSLTDSIISRISSEYSVSLK